MYKSLWDSTSANPAGWHVVDMLGHGIRWHWTALEQILGMRWYEYDWVCTKHDFRGVHRQKYWIQTFVPLSCSIFFVQACWISETAISILWSTSDSSDAPGAQIDNSYGMVPLVGYIKLLSTLFGSRNNASEANPSANPGTPCVVIRLNTADFTWCHHDCHDSSKLNILKHGCRWLQSESHSQLRSASLRNWCIAMPRDPIKVVKLLSKERLKRRTAWFAASEM